MKKSIILQTPTHNIELISNGKEEFENIIICFHGFNGDKWGDAYSALKYTIENSLVCSFDSCGHGKSEISSENMRLDLILEEINVVVNFLKNNFADKPIILVAGSYGAYRVMEYLIKYKPDIKKVIYINPAFRILSILEKVKDFKYSELKETDLIPMKQSLNKYIKKDFLDDLYTNDLYKTDFNITYESYIIIGKKDDLIPINDTLEIAKRFNYPLFYVDDTHCFENKDNYNIVINIIKEAI